MNFASTIFLFLFLPVTVVGYHLVRKNLRNLFLLAASLLFYAWGEPVLVLLLLCSALANYILALGIEYFCSAKWGARGVVSLMLLWNFGVLFYFKYLIFTLRNLNSLFGTALPIPEIALPLGISFFTFRAVSYCLDVYWGTCHAQKNAINVLLYISFFPQVSMGPITKYSTFASQFGERQVSIDSLSDGVRRIIIGLAKKVILADQLGVMVDSIFSMPDSERAALTAWLGILGYVLQLYFDFSGYSDMAIGIGRMFGFDTPENFQYPFLSKSVVEYWSRWHITLGTWLKDYLYTPVFRAVNGKTVPLLQKKISIQYADYIALIAVWLFAGIWHGAAWHYVAYGLYYCFFIVLERIREQHLKQKRRRLKLKKEPQTKLQVVTAHLYFIIVLIFGQLMFRVSGGRDFLPYVMSMFGSIGNTGVDALSIFWIKENFLFLTISIISATPALKIIIGKVREKHKIATTCIENIGIIILAFICCSYVVNASYNPFLYFNF